MTGPSARKCTGQFSFMEGRNGARRNPTHAKANADTAMAQTVEGREEGLRAFQRLADRQMPFATALGLTRIAQRIEGDVARTLPQKLDRPTPFTQRGLTVIPARIRTPVAYVLFKDRQASYLALQETGGIRRPKKRALLVPTNVRLNRYGNMTRNKIRTLLSKDNVFSGEVGGVGGIWQRMKGGGLKLLVRYAKSAEYDPRLDFEDTAQRSFDKHAFERMLSAVQYAIRTAR